MSQFDLVSKTDQKILQMAEDMAGYSSEFQAALREEIQRRGLKTVLFPSGDVSTRQATGSPMGASIGKVIVSTGDIPMPYDIIDPVFAYGSSNDGFLKTANPLEAYEKVAGVLKERAALAGGNGVVHATFDYRVAVSSGCGGGKAFEVFAYGTAVRTRAV